MELHREGSAINGATPSCFDPYGADRNFCVAGYFLFIRVLSGTNVHNYYCSVVFVKRGLPDITFQILSDSNHVSVRLKFSFYSGRARILPVGRNSAQPTGW